MSGNSPGLKKIGFISKLNGYKGELVVAAGNDDWFDESYLFLVLDGIAVPFYVEDIFEKGGNVVVKLEDVSDEISALPFVNREVFIAQKRKSKKIPITQLELQHFRVIDAAYGDLGPIIRIDEFPQQQIAICMVQEKQVLIPLNEDLIDTIDDEERIIRMTLPDGLIDLYLNS